jgi:hypothetical protein
VCQPRAKTIPMKAPLIHGCTFIDSLGGVSFYCGKNYRCTKI